jgi:flagellar basal-body rod protein FlgF
LDNITYIAQSREAVLRRALEVSANNIANTNTNGFKVEHLIYSTQLGPPAKDAGISGPVKFVLDNGMTRDFSEGDLKRTDAPLDVAIEGSGFFTVSTPQGQRYTRDGHFGTDAQGRLVDSAGNTVLDDGGGEIQLDPQQPAPSISADGVVSQGTLRVGKIGVVDFASPWVLSKEGANLYSNPSNSAPTPTTTAKLQQGMLEGSNVKPVTEITNLIQIQRAYEQIAQLISANNDLSQQTIDRLGKAS